MTITNSIPKDALTEPDEHDRIAFFWQAQFAEAGSEVLPDDENFLKHSEKLGSRYARTTVLRYLSTRGAARRPPRAYTESHRTSFTVGFDPRKRTVLLI